MDSLDQADASRESALLSPRSLLIIAISTGIALLLGLSAGIAAALATPVVAGVHGSLLIGLLAGLGTTFVTGLSVAAALNGVVAKK
jgi:hypothetical protein